MGFCVCVEFSGLILEAFWFWFLSSFISFVLFAFEGLSGWRDLRRQAAWGRPARGGVRPDTSDVRGGRPGRRAGWGKRVGSGLDGWEDQGRAAQSGWGQELGWGDLEHRRDPCD